MSAADAPKEPEVADLPGAMRTRGWADYGLLDSGDGRPILETMESEGSRPATVEDVNTSASSS